MKLMLLTNAVTKERQIVNLENVVSVARITEKSKEKFDWYGEDWTHIKLIYGDEECYASVIESPKDIYLLLESNDYIGY